MLTVARKDPRRASALAPRKDEPAEWLRMDDFQTGELEDATELGYVYEQALNNARVGGDAEWQLPCVRPLSARLTKRRVERYYVAGRRGT